MIISHNLSIFLYQTYSINIILLTKACQFYYSTYTYKFLNFDYCQIKVVIKPTNYTNEAHKSTHSQNLGGVYFISIITI